jgi:hypothetical protein
MVAVVLLCLGGALGWAARSLSSPVGERADRGVTGQAQPVSAGPLVQTRTRHTSPPVDGSDGETPASTNSAAAAPGPDPEDGLVARCRAIASLVGAARGRSAGELAADASTDALLRTALWGLMVESDDADILAAVAEAARRNAFMPISGRELDELFGRLTEGDPGDRAPALTWAWAMGQLSVRKEGYEEEFRRLLVAPLRHDAWEALLFGVREASLAERAEVRDALLVAFGSASEPRVRRSILGAVAAGIPPSDKSAFFLDLWGSTAWAAREDVAAAFIDSTGARGRRSAAGALDLSVAGPGTSDHATFLQIYAQTRDPATRTRFASRCRAALGLTSADWVATLLDLARAEPDAGLRERISATAVAIERGEIRDTVTAGSRIAGSGDE